METPLALLIGLLAAVATWLMLSRNLIRLLLGFAMLGNAVNLLIFPSGRLTRNVPPIVPEGSESLAGAYANPLPQALVLTAIVIGFGLLAFCVATHVTASHLALPWLRDGRPRVLAILGGATALALVVRVLADATHTYFLHLGIAGSVWIVGSAVWLATLLPFWMRRA